MGMGTFWREFEVLKKVKCLGAGLLLGFLILVCFPGYVMAHATITREVVEHPQRRVDFLLQSVFKSIHFAVSYQKNAVLYWQQTILLGIFST